ncbi:hypothetical protein [Microcoleus sp.]|uniref:hypothetical protein n=1 Tax=Microcoleus sp. TaxID=44472 RepID=UPI0035246C1D
MILDLFYRRKKEEGRRKKEEGRRKKEEGRRKKEEGRRTNSGEFTPELIQSAEADFVCIAANSIRPELPELVVSKPGFISKILSSYQTLGIGSKG